MVDYSAVLDPNERKRMLQEGWQPEVIDWHAKDRYEKLQEEFRWKNAILKSSGFEQLSYYEFVGELFPGLDKLMVVTAEDTYQEMDIDDLMEYQSGRNDVYVVPASFINGCYADATCRNIYAFVVDIDRIQPETLQAIIENGNLGKMTPMPTYIVNSGRGVHFYYVFQDPVPYYHRNRKILKEMYRKLCGITQKNILAKTDWHAITQPFRLPGSQTRLWQSVTGWRTGDKWHARALAKRLSVDGGDLDLQKRPLVSQQEYREAKERRAAEVDPETGEVKIKKKKPWVSSLAGNVGFYQSCLQRCFDETPEGTRYRSMCALTVVARKCEYPKEHLEQDLLRLLEYYNQIGKHMGQNEINKALKMYNDKALRTKSETLEFWFGWEFRRDGQKKLAKKKEKGIYVKRSRKQICEMARKIQDAYYPDGEWRYRGGAPTKQDLIREWRAAHPDSTPKECIQATGISKNTVYKWWKSVGVEDHE